MAIRHVFRRQRDAPTIADIVAAELLASGLTQGDEADMSAFQQPARAYYELYLECWKAMDGGPRREQGREPDEAAVIEFRFAYQLMVACDWALIARGAESVPFAMQMLASSDSDIREGGAGVLQGIGRAGAETIDAAVSQLRVESDIQVRDVLIGALGAMRNPRAIPVLAELVGDSELDDDSLHGAIEALGKVVRIRFLKREDPLAAALEWIANHPDKTMPTSSA